MSGLLSNIFIPIKVAYIKLFEINKYFAVLVLSVTTTLFLFVLMVALISLGDSGLKEDKSVELSINGIKLQDKMGLHTKVLNQLKVEGNKADLMFEEMQLL